MPCPTSIAATLGRSRSSTSGSPGSALPWWEIFIASTRGNADPGLPQVLDRLRPSVAAIEVGQGNDYGHPAPSTLDALRAVPRVYRTDRDGTVVLRVAGGRMTVETGA